MSVKEKNEEEISVPVRYLDLISESLYKLLIGKDIRLIDLPEKYPDDELRQVIGYLNRFFQLFNDRGEDMERLAGGILEVNIPRGRDLMTSRLKSLQSNLRHLTYKTQLIARGDFTQKIDFIGDFSESFNSMAMQLKEAFEKIEAQKSELEEANKIISLEKEKSEALLLNTLPRNIVEELKVAGKSSPRVFDNVSVFFSDVVGFTEKSSRLSPSFLIDELNDLFTAFDDIMERYDCERIKTIGDAYLAVCGMERKEKMHSCKLLRAAIDIVDYCEKRNRESRVKWEIRVGIHTGSLVGGIVGVKKYLYDIFGDTINTASRMESNSQAMMINVSRQVYENSKDRYRFIAREPLEVKGKGLQEMFFLDCENPFIRESEFA